MKRHPLNLFSLVFGSVLILVAAWAVWNGFPARGWFFDASHWLFPAVVIVVGVALMSPLFTSMRKKTGEDDADEDAFSPATEKPADHL
ncbi:MAG: hypothetical protein OXC98_07925 [bacterium]|nr:hypothetical protein [Acidimicrobiia bacterium]MCY4650283.1 hypothetical protein [bacterium]